MNILLTGATGLIGKKVGQLLVKNGHTVYAVSRDVRKAKLEAPFPAIWIECDTEKETIPLSAPEKIDGVIHLAGENVGERSWNEKQKEKILNSRVLGTRNLFNSLHLDCLPFIIGASAMGYYKPSDSSNNNPLTENDPAGTNFLSEVTQAWENEFTDVCSSCRIVLFRLGVVLSTEGGALPKMLFPAQIFASSPLGSGEQWMSWVHVDDVAQAFAKAVDDNTFKGTFNLVSPQPVKQKQLARSIADHIGAFNGPPVPSFVLKGMMGEQASIALDSYCVSSRKLEKTSFNFKYPDLESALSNLLRGWTDGAAVKKYEQYFDIPREKVFKFFAQAENLEKITPDTLGFHIRSKSTEKIEEGSIIDYTLKIHGVPAKWRTKIESWKPPHTFTDIQLKGPYTTWEHTHTFEDLGSGTLMKDAIRYKVPLGLVGRMASLALINKDVDNIFRHRREVVTQYL